MKTLQQNFTVDFRFSVIFTRDVFRVGNDSIARVLNPVGRGPHRVLVVLDANVVARNPGIQARIREFFESNRSIVELVDKPFLVRGGEICKNDPVEVDAIRALTEKHHLCRHSFVFAVGGGAVLDVAGFAAATAHRGIRLVRFPTTTLAQNDAGVGVKNGVNAFGRKNYLGTFAPPFAVINDFDFLSTLSERDRRAGISEAVKVSLLKDREFFSFLHGRRKRLAEFEAGAMETMIIRCAELHLDHIAQGDPFEFGASRPLDFGHWSAHALEEISSGKIRHGEAVAQGIALDSLYARHQGLLKETELEMIFETLEETGFDLALPALKKVDIAFSINGFREHVGGKLAITLPDGIGNKIDVHDIDVSLLEKCVGLLMARKTRRPLGTSLMAKNVENL